MTANTSVLGGTNAVEPSEGSLVGQASMSSLLVLAQLEVAGKGCLGKNIHWNERLQLDHSQGGVLCDWAFC